MSPLLSRLSNPGGGSPSGYKKQKIKNSSNPTYSISPSTTSVDEASVVTFSITTTNVPNGTTLYYTLSGSANSSDFTSGSTNGSFVITDNSGTVYITASNDATTEGSESFQFQLRTESISGTIVATSSTITINDTSLTPAMTGGTVSTQGGDRIHTFTSSDTLIVSSTKTISYLVIAGGGGGGNACCSGGGGAGGYVESTMTINPGTYTITIGAGGAINANGGDTIFNGITAYGGGTCPGDNLSTPAGTSGGCGGGNGGLGSQGGNGGASAGNWPRVWCPARPCHDICAPFGGGGGGGGAGGNGSNSNGTNGPPTSGGPGKSSSISGSSVTRATGGATTPTSASSPITPVQGPSNSGNGGTGGVGGSAAAGGSGIVIIRYAA